MIVGDESAGKRTVARISLLTIVKANGHEPQARLTGVLTRLPAALDRHIDSLRPHCGKPVA